MSDPTPDLVKRLRSGVIGSDNGARLQHEAADRIEELKAENAMYHELEAAVRTSRVYPVPEVAIILANLREAKGGSSQ